MVTGAFRKHGTVSRSPHSGNFIYRHHVEPRVKLCSPKKESFPIPLKYIEVSRTTHTILDVMQERRISDYWNIDGPKDVSDSWKSFTQFTLSEEKPPDGYMWSGGGLQPIKQKQGVITCGQKFRPVCSKSAQRRSSNGLTRIRSSTMRPSIATVRLWCGSRYLQQISTPPNLLHSILPPCVREAIC